jgi:hypothetical protein
LKLDEKFGLAAPEKNERMGRGALRIGTPRRVGSISSGRR